MIKLDKELVRGSLILLVVFNIYALLNFIFQASMARFLTIADYGVLAALFYLVYILGIFSESIQTVIAKYSSIEEDNGILKNIFNRTVKRIISFSIFFFFIYLLVSIPLSIFRHIPYTLLFINGFFIFFSLLLPVSRGMMQGKKRFYSLGFNLIVESSVKLVLATALVLIGWKVYGAIIGAVLGVFSAFCISFLPIKDLISTKEKKVENINLRETSRSVFLITFSILAFYIADIFIAQLVFSKEIAGYYAIASILSKAIFWGTQPISRAMFPISAAESFQNKKKKKDENLYFNALVLLSLAIFSALIIFYFFPDLIIRVFSGKFINESSSIIFYLAIATSLLSFANLNVLYKLSRRKEVNPYYFFCFFILGIVLLFIFNDTILEFSLAFLTSSALFLWGSIFLLD